MTGMRAEAAGSETAGRRVRGYCALCTAHCATVAIVEGGRVVRLEPDHDHPNGGVICIKGRASPELVYHPERLNYPLRRSRPKGAPDPGWERVSWEEALGAIAARLDDIRRRYGARAVALAKGTRSGTSVDDAERWLSRFLNAFSSPNWVSTTHVCNWHRDTGFSYTFGVNLPRPDLARSGALLLWGHNPSATSIVFAHDIAEARRRGMKLVAVDPRRVGIPGQADVLLQVRPGSDGALALALIHALLEEGWYDAGFVRRWTNGPFLLRAERGSAVTEADLSASGRPDRYVVWDERSDSAAIYDPATGAFDRDGVVPLLFGRRELEGKDGEKIPCRTALDALASRAAQHAPERSEALTRVPAERVWRAAELLAHNRPVSLYMWNGVGQHTNATQTSRAIGVLYALLGDFDRPGGNVIFPGVKLNHVDGKDWLPPDQAALRIGREKKPLGPPARPGNCAAPDIFTAILEGRPYPIKALLNFGSNTILSSADSRRAREAFCALEFSVAVDLFMTPTAELCDYVLPAASFLEMANLAGGFEHRPAGKLHLQYRPAVVAPLYERRSDTWIVFELAKRLGLAERFWGGDIEAGYAYELEPSGVTLDELKASPGGVSVSAETRYEKHAEIDREGAPRGFATPSRRVEIYSTPFAAHGFPPLPDYVEPALSPLSAPEIAADYPLVLTNAKFTAFVHSQQRSLPTLRRAAPEPEAEIHPETASRYGIAHRQWMVVETPRGAIRVRARVTERILPGVVCCQHGWWQECRPLGLPGYDPYGPDGANPSAVVGADLADPISGSFPHRSYLCRVRPAEPR
jgi:anaerobic selenocysteine-containing dehydrogenase